MDYTKDHGMKLVVQCYAMFIQANQMNNYDNMLS